jgi:hypothetical protein
MDKAQMYFNAITPAMEKAPIIAACMFNALSLAVRLSERIA